MIIIFGRKLCNACQEAKRTLEGDEIPYRYIDLDNMDSEEMALAAWHGAMAEGTVLPVIVNDE